MTSEAEKYWKAYWKEQRKKRLASKAKRKANRLKIVNSSNWRQDTRIENLQIQARHIAETRGRSHLFHVARMRMERAMSQADAWPIFASAVMMAEINPNLCRSAFRCKLIMESAKGEGK